MRWIPFIAFFLYVYIEISIFIQVAHVLGVFMTLLLVIFSSVVGMSLVRNQGFKNFLLMQQKMAAGESPAAEMIKSVSLIIAGLLLLLPGFFTDFLGLLLQDEVARREQKKLAQRLRRANFRSQKTLECFDFDRLPTLNRALVHDLATGRFLAEKVAVRAAGREPFAESYHYSSLARDFEELTAIAEVQVAEATGLRSLTGDARARVTDRRG